MLNRTIIATTAVALLLGLRVSAAEISWSEQRDLDHGRIEAWIEDGWLHARRVDSTDDFVAEHGYTMPIVLDTGETYRRFGVEGIPQYVLIGRDGRLAETGLLGSVPSAEQIEALLAAN